MRISVPKFIKEILVRVMLIVVYLLYGYHVIGRDGLVGSFIVVYGIGMFLLLMYVSRITPISLKHDTSFVSKPLRKDIARYSLYILAAALGDNILMKLDVFMVTSQLGLI